MEDKSTQKNIQEVIPVNREVRDTFFKTVYATEKRQRKLASFLSGVEAGLITTANVRPVLFGNKENDLGFMCDDIFYYMIENQATVSPNIPYRLLEYMVAGLRSTVDSARLLYGKGRICFPIPKLYMLQTGLEVWDEKLPLAVQYDLRLSASYRQMDKKYKQKCIESDLEAVVHVYDFRMTLDEILAYIENNIVPERFELYHNDMRDYALVANGITYVQRAMRAEKREGYIMPGNISTVAEFLKLMIKRQIFVDLLADQEVCNMTMAQFSRDDMFFYNGREEGEVIGAIRTYKRMGVTLENARCYIMDAYQMSEEEANEFLKVYWK